MSTARAGIPLVLAVPAYLTGVAVGTFLATAWNSGEEARGLVRVTARTLHRPPRDVRARMAVVAGQRPPAETPRLDAA
jgi:Fe-S cluster assembly ATPase SufC